MKGRKIRSEIWAASLKAHMEQAEELAGLMPSAISRAQTEIDDPNYGSINHMQAANAALRLALHHINDAMGQGRLKDDMTPADKGEKR